MSGWGEYREEVKELLDDLLLRIPGVKAGKAFGYPAYKINRKVFLFIGGDGISLKLPRQRVEDLIADDADIHPFEPVEGTIWKEWVSISRAAAKDYENDQLLFEESVEFVLGG